jgi:1-acyl-sn-glycerol-3-phosphate acyltransferase
MTQNILAAMQQRFERFLDDPPDLGIMRQLFDAAYLRPYFKDKCKITVHGIERLPIEGPALLVANHASLVDAVVIQSCYPLSMLPQVRASAARDHFKKKGWTQYFMAGSMMRLLYLERGSGEAAKAGLVDSFATFHAPLKRGEKIIYFPAGSRDGRPFTTGICHLARQYPEVPVIPILLRGTREFHPPGVGFWKFFPKHPVEMYVGEPFLCDRTIDPHEYVQLLERSIMSLA